MSALIRRDMNAHAHEEFPVHVVGVRDGYYLGIRYTTGVGVKFKEDQIILGQPRDRAVKCSAGHCHHMTIDQSGLCADHHGHRGC